MERLANEIALQPHNLAKGESEVMSGKFDAMQWRRVPANDRPGFVLINLLSQKTIDVGYVTIAGEKYVGWYSDPVPSIEYDIPASPCESSFGHTMSKAIELGFAGVYWQERNRVICPPFADAALLVLEAKG